MPIFEYLCRDCGKLYEEIVANADTIPPCAHCGSEKGRKLLSTSSSLTGKERMNLPGAGDHGCCGGSPGEKGCVPGSCCGKS